MSEPMTVRMMEVRLVPGRVAEWEAVWEATIRPFLDASPGLLSYEAVVSDGDDPRAVVITRWRDEAAVAAFAGPGWRHEVTVLPEEAGLFARPPHVWHFRPAGEGG